LLATHVERKVMSGRFVPDGGRYEVRAYVCGCGSKPYARTPMQVVRLPVIGWMQLGGTITPVVLKSRGAEVILIRDDEKIGSPRLGRVDDEQLTHAELTALHEGYHEQQD
jgi:hypothetical protein